MSASHPSEAEGRTPVTTKPNTRTPDEVKDAWGEVEELAIDAGVDPREWMRAVAVFWKVAGLAADLETLLTAMGDAEGVK